MVCDGFSENAREWSGDEALLLLAMWIKKELTWKQIAKKLGRTTYSVRNKVLRMTASLGKNGSTKAAVNRCSICGELRRGHLCLYAKSVKEDPMKRETSVLLHSEVWRTDMILEAVAKYAPRSTLLFSAQGTDCPLVRKTKMPAQVF
jgi:hypothetical protein